MTRRVPTCLTPCLPMLCVLWLGWPGLPVQAADFAPRSDVPGKSFLSPDVIRSSCSAARAHALIGQTLSAETRRQAQDRSGASSSRVVRLGGLRDLSLEETRLSIEVDAAGVISSFSCS